MTEETSKPTVVEVSPKKRGRPPKELKKEGKPSILPSMQGLSVLEALAAGFIVLKEDVDKIAAEEVTKVRALIKEEVRAELAQERADKHAEGRREAAADYMVKAGLTDADFCVRLMEMNVTPEMAQFLRNEHQSLDRKQIWAYIRKNQHKK